MHFRATLAALLFVAAAPLTAIADTPVQPAASSVGSYTDAVQELAIEALSHLGIRYRWGGESRETGLDCSGLVRNVFRNAIGLDLPRTAAEMAAVGDRIKRSELQPGDLVFFNTMRRTFSHVGIYLGEGKFVHAPSSGGKVRVESMHVSYWSKRFNGGRRLLDDELAGGGLIAGAMLR